MLGLMAEKMVGNDATKEMDMNRFGEIMNGAPLTSFEANAVKCMLGAIMSTTAPSVAQPSANPIMGLLGGESSENPIMGMLNGLLSK